MVMLDKDVALDDPFGCNAEGGRRPGDALQPKGADPELSSSRPRRWRFTVQDKLRILDETDRAEGSGGIGAILRREGLYSAALQDWRRQRAAGRLGGEAPCKRGPKPGAANTAAGDLADAQAEIVKLRLRLERAEAIIDLQKKVSALLGMALA